MIGVFISGSLGIEGMDGRPGVVMVGKVTEGIPIVGIYGMAGNFGMLGDGIFIDGKFGILGMAGLGRLTVGNAGMFGIDGIPIGL